MISGATPASHQVSALSKVGLKSKNKSFAKRLTFSVPQRFSLIDNPEQTLNFISEIAQQSRNEKLRSLLLDHSALIDHDLAAEHLLGVAASDIKKIAAFRNRQVVLMGKYPKSQRKRRLIRAMGVVKQLEIQSEIITDNDDKIEIFYFEGKKEKKVIFGSEDRKNLCAKKFVLHMNKCLNYGSQRLTDDAVQRLLGFIGEIIGNAEDHSGDPRWYVCAYLDESDDHPEDRSLEVELHYCEIVIYNYGKSIADTFLELPVDSYAFSLIKPYIETHRLKNLFGNAWEEEDLITLASLQSHISSKHIDRNSDRGQGTIDLIEFFQQVAQECALEQSIHTKMSILSGSTHILFDQKYKLATTPEGREIIAFNKENDLHQKPDSSYIKHMSKVKFPGTLISIRFPLGPEYTESSIEIEGEVQNDSSNQKN